MGPASPRSFLGQGSKNAPNSWRHAPQNLGPAPKIAPADWWHAPHFWLPWLGAPHHFVPRSVGGLHRWTRPADAGAPAFFAGFIRPANWGMPPKIAPNYWRRAPHFWECWRKQEHSPRVYSRLAQVGARHVATVLSTTTKSASKKVSILTILWDAFGRHVLFFT